jgi:hypothetical protein
LGMNPVVSDAAPFSSSQSGLPFAAIETVSGTNSLSLKVKRPIGRLGISYGAEASSDLVTWTPVNQIGVPVSNGSDTEILTYRDTVPISAASKRFLRLKITKL